MIVYLHGFNSSPASAKATVLRDWLAARGLADRYRCPELPPHPRAARRVIEDALRDCGPDRVTFVGSSLGGFYATWFTERARNGAVLHGTSAIDLRAVLINPAVSPHHGLRTALGPQQNLHTGERYTLTEDDLARWRDMDAATVDPERYLLLLETGDEVLDWRRAARKYEGARMVVREGGDHSLRSFPEHLPRILAFSGLADRRSPGVAA